MPLSPPRALFRSTAIALAATVAAAIATVDVGRVAAEIDGDTLVATEHGLRLDLPRGWRASEVSAYPGVVVWLARTTPRVTIIVTVDPLVGPCRDPLRFCAAESAIDVVRQQLDDAGFRITAQTQSRTPELEYQAGKRFLRHAVLVVGDQVVSVILAADSPANRAAQGRVFDRLTQTVRPLAAPPRRATSADEPGAAPP